MPSILSTSFTLFFLLPLITSLQIPIFPQPECTKSHVQTLVPSAADCDAAVDMIRNKATFKRVNLVAHAASRDDIELPWTYSSPTATNDIRCEIFLNLASGQSKENVALSRIAEAAQSIIDNCLSPENFPATTGANKVNAIEITVHGVSTKPASPVTNELRRRSPGESFGPPTGTYGIPGFSEGEPQGAGALNGDGALADSLYEGDYRKRASDGPERRESSNSKQARRRLKCGGALCPGAGANPMADSLYTEDY